MSMVSGVVGGVDKHADVHVAAALDENGGMLGIESCTVFQTQCATDNAMIDGTVTIITDGTTTFQATASHSTNTVTAPIHP